MPYFVWSTNYSRRVWRNLRHRSMPFVSFVSFDHIKNTNIWHYLIDFNKNWLECGVAFDRTHITQWIKVYVCMLCVCVHYVWKSPILVWHQSICLESLAMEFAVGSYQISRVTKIAHSFTRSFVRSFIRLSAHFSNSSAIQRNDNDKKTLWREIEFKIERKAFN